MTERLQFTYGITKRFRAARTVPAPVGAWFESAPEESAEDVPGSTDLVRTLPIVLVTAGAFEEHVPGFGVIRLEAGDMASPSRYRVTTRIQAAEPGSAYVCLAPRDGRFWERQAVHAEAGDAVAIETPEAEEAFVYVASGRLSDGARVLEAGGLYAVPPGATAAFTAAAETRLIHVWR